MAKQKEADLFHAGTLTDGWKWFGAHPEERRGRKGWVFRVWAPHAKAVSVVGDFNNWNQKANKLSRRARFGRALLPICRPTQPINIASPVLTGKSA